MVYLVYSVCLVCLVEIVMDVRGLKNSIKGPKTYLRIKQKVRFKDFNKGIEITQ